MKFRPQFATSWRKYSRLDCKNWKNFCFVGLSTFLEVFSVGGATLNMGSITLIWDSYWYNYFMLILLLEISSKVHLKVQFRVNLCSMEKRIAIVGVGGAASRKTTSSMFFTTFHDEDRLSPVTWRRVIMQSVTSPPEDSFDVTSPRRRWPLPATVSARLISTTWPAWGRPSSLPRIQFLVA